LRIDTNRKQLEQLAAIGFYKLPLDWLESYPARLQAVTLDQVRAAFARRVPPEKLAVVIVGASD
jgi:zinc protease